MCYGETLKDRQRKGFYDRSDSTRSDCYIATQSEKFTWSLRWERVTIVLPFIFHEQVKQKKNARGPGFLSLSFLFFFFFDNSARSSTRVERTSLPGNVTGGKEEERREFLSDSAIPKVFREISF